MQRRIILQYYGLSCLFNAGGLSIISAIYVSFLIKNGLNLFEVNLVNTVFYLTLFICEIPTGAFADIFGRKTSFVSACILMSMSMFIYGSAHTFWGFVLAETIGAVGSTFRSGAFQAWFVDSMRHNNYQGEFSHFFGRESFIRQLCSCLGAILGSYLAYYNSSLPWFTGGSILLITTLIAYIIMNEDYFIRNKFQWKSGLLTMKSIAISSIHYGMNDVTVRFILVITGLQIFSVQALNMYWQPFLKLHGANEKYFGYFISAAMISVSLGAFLSSKIISRKSGKETIIIVQIFIGVLIISLALMNKLPMIILLFLLHEIPRGFITPLIDNYLHNRIPSNERATISSFCAIAPHIGGAFGLLISGVIANSCGISIAWIVSGSVLIIGAILIARNGRNNNSK